MTQHFSPILVDTLGGAWHNLCRVCDVYVSNTCSKWTMTSQQHVHYENMHGYVIVLIVLWRMKFWVLCSLE